MTLADLTPERRRGVLAGVIGNVLEWYDFAIYGFFAVIIGQQFFPNKDPTVSLIAAFGVFAAGFLMRPIGAFLFGHIGDRIGRRDALLLSTLMMGVPSFLIGVLPTYAEIGLLAPAAMMGLRLLQGLSVGGEFTSSAVYVAESAPVARRGFFGSFVTAGADVGILLGSAIGALLNTILSAEAMADWGWRLPFLAGFGLAIYGFVLRRKMADEARPAPCQDLPVVVAIRDHWPTMLRAAAACVMAAIGFYIAFVFATTYLQTTAGLSARAALDINSLAMLVLVALNPVFGHLSDRIGRKPIMVAAALGLVLAALPVFELLHSGSLLAALLGQVIFAVLIAAYLGVLPTYLVENFPPAIRCSAVSISYNVVFGVVGGTVPIVATYFMQRAHDDLAPAYYLMAGALVSLPALLLGPETAPSRQSSRSPVP